MLNKIYKINSKDFYLDMDSISKLISEQKWEELLDFIKNKEGVIRFYIVKEKIWSLVIFFTSLIILYIFFFLTIGLPPTVELLETDGFLQKYLKYINNFNLFNLLGLNILFSFVEKQFPTFSNIILDLLWVIFSIIFIPIIFGIVWVLFTTIVEIDLRKNTISIKKGLNIIIFQSSIQNFRNFYDIKIEGIRKNEDLDDDYSYITYDMKLKLLDKRTNKSEEYLIIDEIYPPEFLEYIINNL